MIDQLEQFGLQFERIEAVDGRSMSGDVYAKFCDAWPLRAEWDRPNPTWSRGEVGCLLSHLAVLRTFLQTDESHALVLEDDVHIASDLKQILADLSWWPPDGDIVRLEATTERVVLRSKTTISATLETRAVYRLLTTTGNAGAFIITRSAAQYILNQSEIYRDIYDVMIFSRRRSKIARNLKTYQVNPAVVIQDRNQETEVNSKYFISNIDQNGYKLTGRKLIARKLYTFINVIFLAKFVYFQN